jgi:hypothetical protein
MVECNCVLPQFLSVHPTVWHKFVVFTEINSDGSVKPHYAQCNNCKAVHKIVEISKPTERVNKESSMLIPTIEDIEGQIPEKYSSLLKRYNAPLHVWQSVKFIIENGKWGTAILLSKEKENNHVAGKFVIILSEQMFKLEEFTNLYQRVRT